MRLLRALQSMRLCADAEMASNNSKGKNRSRSITDQFTGCESIIRSGCSRLPLYSLITVSLVAQGLNGVKARSAACGVQTGQQADQYCKRDSSENQPPRDEPNLFRRKMLPLKIHVRSQINDASDGPAQRNAYEPAKYAHHAGLGEEQSFHVAVAGADGLHDSNFAAAFEDCHDERIDDSNRGDGKSQAAEDSEKQVEHGKELPQAARCVHDRKGIEPHLLDCL